MHPRSLARLFVRSFNFEIYRIFYFSPPSTFEFHQWFILQALTHAQIRRGAFNNSGSRDAGKDPHWDFKTGTRIKDESYTELFLKDNPNQIDHGDKFFRGATDRRN